MRLWKPAPIADSRSGNEEQHEWGSGSTVLINYWVQSSSAPRCYNCNFCKREFKSAQALGGHMNVHRRDRALLRLTSSSISPSTILPQDDNPILTCKPDIRVLGEGLDCLPQQPHSALATSSENRSTTASPFLREFDDDSRNSGCHCQTPYSKEADMYRLRSDAVNGNSFELNIEQPICPHPLSVAGSGGIVEKRMRCLAVPGQDALSNVGLDLELRLGNTSSSQPS